MKFLQTIIVATMLVSISAPAAVDMLPRLKTMQQYFAAQLKRHNIPNYHKSDDYFIQKFFKAGVQLDQAEVLALGQWEESTLTTWREIYSKREGLSDEQASLKMLFNEMISGRTDIADTMVKKGVKLSKPLLQELLHRQIRQKIWRMWQGAEPPNQAWWDWLLAQGADINESSLKMASVAYAIEYDYTDYIDEWVSDNKYSTQQLNTLLRLAALNGSASLHTLLQHGAEMNSLTQEEIAQHKLLDYLPDLNNSPDLTATDSALSSFLAHGSSSAFNTVLQITAEFVTMSTRTYKDKESYDSYIVLMDKLLEHGASVDALDMQKLLFDYLKSKQLVGLAEWVVEHGGDINALDVNDLIHIVIAYNVAYLISYWKNEILVDAEDFFALLTKLGLDKNKLDLPRLLEYAEEKDRQLLRWAKEKGIGDAPTTGFAAQLRLLSQEGEAN